LRCVVAWCSALQRVAASCSVLQCTDELMSRGIESFNGGVCCSVLQCVAVCCSLLQCVAVYRRAGVSRHCKFQCAAMCCSVLQCMAARGSVLQCVVTCCNVPTCSCSWAL